MSTTQKVPLGELTDLLSGFAFKSEYFNDENGLPLVRIRDVVPGVSGTKYSGAYDANYVVDDGQMLVGMDGEFNVARWRGGRALLNQRVCRIRSASALLHDGYLFHFLPQKLKEIEAATPYVTVKHLSVKQIRDIEIPLPPVSEQRRIAAILDKAENLRAKRRQTLERVDGLLRSVFLDLFGETIIFAKNHNHAEFIADRFNKNYPHHAGKFARVIDFQVEYAQSLIDAFSKAEEAPHIAISVDMLDTGIDVPEILNLVFFKLVRSKTKFWQMVGRGTRLRPDLFGPGKDKKCFTIFDYCQNLEFFSQNPETTDGASGDSLEKKLFTTRVELVAALDKLVTAEGGDGIADLRKDTAELLQSRVAAMNVNNFVVRPQRKLVEQYADAKAWEALTLERQAELENIAGLPSELTDEDQDAKQFDLLMLRLQLAMLNSDKSFGRLSQQVRDIAGELATMASIPMVAQQMALILEIQSDEYWQDVTTPMLENIRKKLRSLMKLIEKKKRNHVYTNFEDELGAETEVRFQGISTGGDYERFKAKALEFLKAHESDTVIRKLRWNEPLKPTDLQSLETMLVEAGAGSAEDLDRAKKESLGLGLFVRSLVGLDREAAKQAFASFLQDKSLNANQIEFVNLVIDHLTRRGWMDAGALYESPFTDYSSKGVDGVFCPTHVDRFVAILGDIRQRAAA